MNYMNLCFKLKNLVICGNLRNYMNLYYKELGYLWKPEKLYELVF